MLERKESKSGKEEPTPQRPKRDMYAKLPTSLTPASGSARLHVWVALQRMMFNCAPCLLLAGSQNSMERKHHRMNAAPALSCGRAVHHPSCGEEGLDFEHI